MTILNQFDKLEQSDIDELLNDIDLGPDSNLQLPDPHLRDFYKDEKNRILWLDDDIEERSLELNYKIMQYNKEDLNTPTEQRKPIKLFINTMGGSVPVMWSIIQCIKMSKTPVWTINWSACYSAGAHILAAGHKRLGMPGSTVLIHSGSCVYGGTAEQADNAKKYYDALGKKANDQLLKDSKIDPKVMKKKSPFDWYLTDDEALANGVIDKIVENFDELF